MALLIEGESGNNLLDNTPLLLVFLLVSSLANGLLILLVLPLPFSSE